MSAKKGSKSRPDKYEGNPDRDLPGIGNYMFIKTLGEGNFAKVKLAKHKLTSQEVAIKIIDKTKLDEKKLSKLYREVKIMKLLHHPHIVRLYEVIETKSTVFLVMEYSSGGELYDYLVVHGRMKEKDARTKFRQILSAVAYCHKKRVIHRDLKAENLLLDSNLNIKIADFGFSNHYNPEDKLDTFCGSPPYAAPELFQGRRYTGPEVDVWSLGVILYVLTTGCLPFDGKNLQEMRESVCRGKYRVPFYLSDGCEKLLRKFLVRDPAKRSSLDIIADDPWINEGFNDSPISSDLSLQINVDEEILQIIDKKFHIKPETVLKSLKEDIYDDAAAIYHLLHHERDQHKTGSDSESPFNGATSPAAAEKNQSGSGGASASSASSSANGGGAASSDQSPSGPASNASNAAAASAAASVVSRDDSILTNAIRPASGRAIPPLAVTPLAPIINTNNNNNNNNNASSSGNGQQQQQQPTVVIMVPNAANGGEDPSELPQVRPTSAARKAHPRQRRFTVGNEQELLKYADSEESRTAADVLRIRAPAPPILGANDVLAAAAEGKSPRLNMALDAVTVAGGGVGVVGGATSGLDVASAAATGRADQRSPTTASFSGALPLQPIGAPLSAGGGIPNGGNLESGANHSNLVGVAGGNGGGVGGVAATNAGGSGVSANSGSNDASEGGAENDALGEPIIRRKRTNTFVGIFRNHMRRQSEIGPSALLPVPAGAGGPGMPVSGADSGSMFGASANTMTGMDPSNSVSTASGVSPLMPVPPSDDSQPRSLRFTFNSNSTSSKDPDEIVGEVMATATNLGFAVSRTSRYLVTCDVNMPGGVVRFEVEVCKLPRLRNLHGLRFKRLLGSSADYKDVCENLLGAVKL